MKARQLSSRRISCAAITGLVLCLLCAGCQADTVLVQTPPAVVAAPKMTPIPETWVEVLVASEADAIQRAIQYDGIFTTREQPLDAADGKSFTVQRFATRQAAADSYQGGVFTDPTVAAEPVWMITITGKALVKNMGIRAAFQSTLDASSVVYVISESTGELRSFWAVPEASGRSQQLPTRIPTRPLATAASTQAPTAVPTLRGYAGYPVTDTTPGGITILSKSDIILIPNPVTSAPADWPIYAEPFYSYTVAYPPNWFLVEPTGVRKTHGVNAKIAPGLSTNINSFDLSKAPENEAVARNPQDALHIDITLDEDSLRPGEGLKDCAQRQGWYWAESIKSLEETDHAGLSALRLHIDKRGLIPNGGTSLMILIAATDGRVYRIGAMPIPEDTIYPAVFQQILDSFTILDN